MSEVGRRASVSHLVPLEEEQEHEAGGEGGGGGGGGGHSMRPSAGPSLTRMPYAPPPDTQIGWEWTKRHKRHGGTRSCPAQPFFFFSSFCQLCWRPCSCCCSCSCCCCCCCCQHPPSRDPPVSESQEADLDAWRRHGQEACQAIYGCVCVFVFVCVRARGRVCVCVCVCTHNTHTHTHTHTHLHTQEGHTTNCESGWEICILFLTP